MLGSSGGAAVVVVVEVVANVVVEANVVVSREVPCRLIFGKKANQFPVTFVVDFHRVVMVVARLEVNLREDHQ